MKPILPHNRIMRTTYSVTKRFTAGFLAGITITETTTVRFEAGREYKACVGSSRYLVLSCVRIGQ